MNSDPYSNSLPGQPNELTSSNKRNGTSPELIGKECIDNLNKQLEELSFSARSDMLSEDGIPIPTQFIEVLRQGDEEEKRFLVNVIYLHLSGISEDLDQESYRKKMNTLKIICETFVSYFKPNTRCENGTYCIYIYLICMKRPKPVYEIMLRDFTENIRLRKVKFIARDELCDLKEIVRLNLHKRFQNGLQGYLCGLLDLEEAQPGSSEIKEKVPHSISSQPKISRKDRRRLINIIRNMIRFDKGNRRAFVIDYLGVQVSNDFPYDGDGFQAASKLVGVALVSFDEFENLLEGLLSTDDVQDSDTKNDKSFLQELKALCPGEQ